MQAFAQKMPKFSRQISSGTSFFQFLGFPKWSWIQPPKHRRGCLLTTEFVAAGPLCGSCGPTINHKKLMLDLKKLYMGITTTLLSLFFGYNNIFGSLYYSRVKVIKKGKLGKCMDSETNGSHLLFACPQQPGFHRSCRWVVVFNP